MDALNNTAADARRLTTPAPEAPMLTSDTAQDYIDRLAADGHVSAAVAEQEKLIAYRVGRCKQAETVLGALRDQLATALRLTGQPRRKALLKVQDGLDNYVWPIRDRDGHDPGFADVARVLSHEIKCVVDGERWAIESLVRRVR